VGLSFILVLCVAGAFCLAPLAVYLLWLAQITRRERPTIIAGTWDYAVLIVGLSGFIIFGGGLILSLLQSNFRYWMRGNAEGLRAAWGQEWLTWTLLGLLYLLFVIGGISLTLMSRRRTLVVYNVDLAVFESTLNEVFEHLDRPIERRGNVWFSSVPLFELERFPRGKTATLRWLAEDRLLYQDVERLLREMVRSLSTEENAVTQWIMAAAVGVGLSAISCFGLLIYAMRLIYR
jgi:hypothetical protein